MNVGELIERLNRIGALRYEDWRAWVIEESGNSNPTREDVNAAALAWLKDKADGSIWLDPEEEQMLGEFLENVVPKHFDGSVVDALAFLERYGPEIASKDVADLKTYLNSPTGLAMIEKFNGHTGEQIGEMSHFFQQESNQDLSGYQVLRELEGPESVGNTSGSLLAAVTGIMPQQPDTAASAAPAPEAAHAQSAPPALMA